jgi:hypothetical protein
MSGFHERNKNNGWEMGSDLSGTGIGNGPSKNGQEEEVTESPISIHFNFNFNSTLQSPLIIATSAPNVNSKNKC